MKPIVQWLLDAFLDAEKVNQQFGLSPSAQAVESHPESQIEPLAREIQNAYPELQLRVGEDEGGAYIEVVFGDDEDDYWLIRSAEEWRNPNRYTQKSLARAIEYGRQRYLTTIAG